MELKMMTNKQITNRKMRIFLIGKAGVGKTTFACNLKDVCVIDLEDKARWFEDEEIRILRPNDYFETEQCLEVLGQMKKDKNKPKIIAIDTIDCLNYYYRNYHLEKQGMSSEAADKFGKIYDIIKKSIMKFLKSIYAMDYSIIILGHIKDKEVTDGKKNYTKTVIAIPETIKYELAIWVDIIADYTYDDKNERMIQLGSTIYSDAKTNIPDLPDSMKPEEFCAWINERI